MGPDRFHGEPFCQTPVYIFCHNLSILVFQLLEPATELRKRPRQNTDTCSWCKRFVILSRWVTFRRLQAFPRRPFSLSTFGGFFFVACKIHGRVDTLLLLLLKCQVRLLLFFFSLPKYCLHLINWNWFGLVDLSLAEKDV